MPERTADDVVNDFKNGVLLACDIADMKLLIARIQHLEDEAERAYYDYLEER